jgi:large subunit ribosomal protein L29
MKAGEIRALSLEEMQKKVETLKETYFNLRFQHETGQLENSSMLARTRRDIARVKTIIKQMQLS